MVNGRWGVDRSRRRALRRDELGAGTRGNRRQLDAEWAPSPVPPLDAEGWPPCCSTIDRLIVRPRPSPPYRRPDADSAWSKTSKIRGKLIGLDADPRVADLDDQAGARRRPASLSASRVRTGP